MPATIDLARRLEIRYPRGVISLLALAAVAAPAAAASPVLGLDWTPLSRGDLVWAGSDQLTGELVGELDGLIRPAMTAYGGAWWGDWGLLAGLGYAQLTSVDWTGDGYRKTTAGGLRPSIDVQRALGPREIGGATPWIGAGLSGVVPFAADVSDAYSVDEQAEAAASAAEIRGRIGGGGGRLGLGGDHRVNESLTIGLRYHWNVFVARSGSGDSYAASLLGYGEAGLRIQLEL